MEVLPNELHLLIIAYLNPDDIDNYLNSYSKHLSKTDLIFLINARTPMLTKRILDFNNILYQFDNTSWNSEYSVYRYIRYQTDHTIFMSEYKAAIYIYLGYRDLYNMIYKEMYYTGWWNDLYENMLVNDVMDYPFINFRPNFDMYSLMDILDEYKLVGEFEPDYYRETADELSNNNILTEKYLKWLYNKYGDKGYFIFLIEHPDILRWFLSLETNSEYPNIRGSIFIDNLEEIDERLIEESELTSFKNVLEEYVNKYDDDIKHFDNIANAKDILEWLENRD